MLYNYQGELVIQTERFSEQYSRDEIMFSKWVNENILFSKVGNILNLFYLDKKTTTITPTEARLISWRSTVHPKMGNINVVVQGTYCILGGYDEDEHNAFWVYSFRMYENHKGLQFSMKITLDGTPHNLEVQETNEELIICFQYHRAGDLISDKIKFPIPKSIIM